MQRDSTLGTSKQELQSSYAHVIIGGTDLTPYTLNKHSQRLDWLSMIPNSKLGRGLASMSKVSLSSLKKIPEADPSMGTEAIPPARVLCIASGKGGTGKSMLASNLAICFAGMKKRTLILDADFGLANIHLLMGITPERTIADVITHGEKIEEVIETGPLSVEVICGTAGVTEFADLSGHQLSLFVEALAQIETRADVVMIDTPAGIAPQTMMFLYPATEMIVVTTTDISAIMDAYSTLKATVMKNREVSVGLVANRVASEREGEAVFKRISEVAGRFLHQKLLYYGHIPESKAISESLIERTPVVMTHPRTKVAKAIFAIARAIERNGPPAQAESFSRRMRALYG